MASRQSESRFLPIVMSVALMFLLVIMPARYFLLPRPVGSCLGTIVVASMVLAGAMPSTSVWASVERWVIWVGGAIVILIELIVLTTLVLDIVVHRHDVTPLTLLASAIGVWTTNVLTCSLVYWQLDRGGPAGRVLGWAGRADFTFAQGNPGDGVPDDWQPSYDD